jgi:hypothetical protein
MGVAGVGAADGLARASIMAAIIAVTGIGGIIGAGNRPTLNPTMNRRHRVDAAGFSLRSECKRMPRFKGRGARSNFLSCRAFSG